MNALLTNGNYFFTAIFAVESFGKLAAMSPRYFFAVSVGQISNYAIRNVLLLLFFFREIKIQISSRTVGTFLILSLLCFPLWNS